MNWTESGILPLVTEVDTTTVRGECPKELNLIGASAAKFWKFSQVAVVLWTWKLGAGTIGGMSVRTELVPLEPPRSVKFTGA